MSHDRGVSDVWYVSYGSNLLRERFLTYLAGGRPPGVTDGTIQRGARDPTPPSDDTPIDLAHQLYFAGASTRWGGGGVAYVEPGTDVQPSTWARAYRITWPQFEDVVAQENRRETAPIDRRALSAGTTRSVTPGSYGLVMGLGRLADAPLVSFTSPDDRRPSSLNAPDVAYLAVMASGLAQSRGLPLDEVAVHLCRQPQIAAVWTPATLTTALAAPRPESG